MFGFKNKNSPRLYKISSRVKIQQNRNKAIKTALVLIALFVFTTGLAYGALATDFLKVSTIVINPSESDFAGEIDIFVNKWLSEHSHNILLISYETLRADLASNFPRLEFIDVSRQGRQAINIYFDRKIPFAKYCTIIEREESCKYLDDYGEVIDFETNSANPFIVEIRDERNEQQNTKEILSTVRGIREKIQKLNIEVARFIIPEDSLPSMIIKTKNGLDIVISLGHNLDDQINVLQKSLELKINQEDFEKLKYIDLRTPDRVYYQ